MGLFETIEHVQNGEVFEIVDRGNSGTVLVLCFFSNSIELCQELIEIDVLTPWARV